MHEASILASVSSVADDLAGVMSVDAGTAVLNPTAWADPHPSQTHSACGQCGAIFGNRAGKPLI